MRRLFCKCLEAGGLVWRTLVLKRKNSLGLGRLDLSLGSAVRGCKWALHKTLRK